MNKSLIPIFFVTLALAAAGAVAAAPEHVELPKGDSMLLPLDAGVSARMIYVTTGTLASHPGRPPIFLIDQDGSPWLASRGNILLDLMKESLIVVDPKFDDVALFEDGTFVLCADGAMGSLVEASPEQKRKNKYSMAFRPRLKLPYKKMRIFEGENGTIYLVGKNPKDGKNELFTATDDGRGRKNIVKLVAVQEPIDSVAGDGGTTYFSSGPLVVKVGPDRKKMEGYLKLAPENAIRQLAYSSKAGLFFTTAKGVGFVGEKDPQMFLHAPDASIRIRKNSLFVLFTKEQDVLEIDGIAGYGKLLGRR